MNERIDAAELLKGTTPGPWAMETVKTSSGSCHKIGKFPSNGVHWETSACVYADGEHWLTEYLTENGRTLIANARLIAAAPALAARVVELENALRELERGARELTQGVRNELPDLSVPLTCAMRASDVARAALAQESP